MQETGTPNLAAAAADDAGARTADVRSADSVVQTTAPIIRAEKIEKYYAQPSQNRIQVISATDLAIVPGEILALLGPSGSGK